MNVSTWSDEERQLRDWRESAWRQRVANPQGLLQTCDGPATYAFKDDTLRTKKKGKKKQQYAGKLMRTLLLLVPNYWL